MNDVCLHVENINSDVKILPEYSCLLMSPTHLWHQDLEEFRTDNSLEKTIFAFRVFTFFVKFNKSIFKVKSLIITDAVSGLYIYCNYKCQLFPYV